MLTTDIIVKQFAEGVIAGIKENIRTKQNPPYGPANTTGHAADSLYYTWDGHKLIIASTWEFITVLEEGRKPGKMPPRDEIAKWIDKKPVEGGISRDSLAFLIQRSIGKHGSALFRDGGHSGILSEYLNEEYVQENLSDVFRDNIVATITNALLQKAA